MNDPVFDGLAQAAREGEPVALGIICGVKGSSPQKLGAKALFYADGRIRGTLGGGCLEAEIQRRAIDTLRTGKSALFDLVLDHDFGWDDGLICGGKVEGVILPNAQRAGEPFWTTLRERNRLLHWGVRPDFNLHMEVGDQDQKNASSDKAWLYEETVSPPSVLWIAGAGHIAQAVAPLAAQLDFAVTVLDDRPALLNDQFFPPGLALQADGWDNLLALTPPDRPSFGLIVTRGHRHDALVLRSWLRQPFVFLGMIGSSRKARIIRDHFLAEKLVTPADWERVACPVGLPIRSQSVMEIAVSIMAQFIQKRAELAKASQ